VFDKDHDQLLPQLQTQTMSTEEEYTYEKEDELLYTGKVFSNDKVHSLFNYLRKPGLFSSLKYLDSGVYGYCIRGISAENGRAYAIKLMASKSNQACIECTALREIRAMSHLYHQNILRLSKIFIIHGGIATVTPLYDSNLEMFMMESTSIPMPVLKYIGKQILQGIHAAHCVGVMHRDLKPANILMKNGIRDVVIADWGLSTFTHNGSLDMGSSDVCTQWYAPPEILCKLPEYNTAVDMWSIGIILLELAYKKHIFLHSDRARFLKEVLKLIGTEDVTPREWVYLENIINGHGKIHSLTKSGPYASTIPQLLKGTEFENHKPFIDLVRKLLKPIPCDRLSAEDALNHPFFAEEDTFDAAIVITPKFVLEHGEISAFELPTEYAVLETYIILRPINDDVPMLGWCDGCAVADALRIQCYAAKYERYLESLLLAMYMSRIIEPASAPCTIRWMFACFTLAMASCASPVDVIYIRNDEKPSMHRRNLFKYGINSVSDLANWEATVLIGIGGCVPVLPKSWEPFVYNLISNGSGQKMLADSLSARTGPISYEDAKRMDA
jgi:serine/threonine protein kinase